MRCLAANTLWMAGCLPEYARFRRAVGRVADEQLQVLRRIVRQNVASEFGRQHGFGTVRSVADFRRCVPPRYFEDYQPWVARASMGEPRILTDDPIRLFEPTSGSSGPSKLVPYTNALRREFQCGIRAWVADLFLDVPGLLGGSAYWSVSPVVSRQRTSGGIPVGFDDDSDYVGGVQRRFVEAVMAVPASDRLVGDVDASKHLTLLRLVGRGDLRLMSVWSPAFLEILMEGLSECGDLVTYDLEHGTFRGQSPVTIGLREGSLTADAGRAARLREALRATSPAERHMRLWPELKVVSCWADGNACSGALRLAALFPQAGIRGKGLIATEGFISFPVSGRHGCALAVRSHFLEFLPCRDDGAVDSDQPLLAEQLEVGRRYTVVLTTGGGLYRYRLDDVVEVVDLWARCPLVRFIGRMGRVSDWVGEKLNDAHVSDVFERVFSATGVRPAFSLLACDASARPASYVWYVDATERDDTLLRAGDEVERRLQSENFHYDYARRLGQLGPLRVFRAESGASSYVAARVASGQRAGAVKLPALDPDAEWAQHLRGGFLTRPITRVDTRYVAGRAA